MDNAGTMLQMAHDSVQAGGSGHVLGRNIFHHRQPARIVQALHGIVHLNWDVDQGMELLTDNACGRHDQGNLAKAVPLTRSSSPWHLEVGVDAILADDADVKKIEALDG
jgi:hypothetical protein